MGRWGGEWAAANQAATASPPARLSRRPEPSSQRLVSRAETTFGGAAQACHVHLRGALPLLVLHLALEPEARPARPAVAALELEVVQVAVL